MHSIRLVLITALVLTATTACAQYGSGGMNRGGRRGGGGLYGVTRRSFMGGPNAMAARYFQNSGVPLVDPQKVDAVASGDDAFLAATPPPTATPRPVQPIRPPAAIATQPKRPAITPTPTPAAQTPRGLAQVGR